MLDPVQDGGDASLTNRQISILIAIERTGAGFSMAAIVITLVTFVCFKKMRTMPNLFLVFASLANAGASIASMIGYDGLIRGENSSLCQAQAFLMQWFMQSDPWWSFAMAVNVYLVFFHNADPSSFRKYLWVYCLVCFGGPMVPAIILISIRDDVRGPIFGDAVLWCWIGPEWTLLRLYAYYIPIWMCILLSAVAYSAVGYRVFRHRNKLMSLGLERLEQPRKPSRSGSDGDSAEEARCPTPLLPSSAADGFPQSLTRHRDAYGIVVTEVYVTTGTTTSQHDPPLIPSATYHPAGVTDYTFDPFWSVLLPRDAPGSRDGQTQHQFETVCTSNHRRQQRATVLEKFHGILSRASLKLKRLDPVKMAYLRTSFVFAFAVLITWIPSSINRLYSITHNGKISFPLSVASGCVLPLQGVWNAIIYLTTS
ncbi:G-protein coupled receptor protein [Purpureocillium lilacinum]|uniref:G-protein coupled receptor protein n=1 Tax=Purpureocillium lilacinum TaxID=33203 RepID=A0A179I177_PURLI|nr:G-protein coupled receptor protein [Purpureocillium lilacinum]OAQ95508.1 G-protein coupled receptor protein [Purpureocillium lilacinum]